MFPVAPFLLSAAVGTYAAVVLSSLAAAGLLALAISFLRTWLKTRRWIKVKARVVSWDWEERKEGAKTKYVLRRLYEYTADGRTHCGSGGDDLSLDQDEPKDEKGEIKQPGEEIDAFYDPQNPNHAVLERNAGGCGWMLVVLTACFLGLAAYCVYEAFPPEPPPRPLPAEAPENYTPRQP